MSDVARRAILTAKKLRATPREIKALTEAGIVESGMRQLQGGDRDSTGFLQQRPSQGWGPVGQSVEQDTAQFLAAARKINRTGFKGSAGQLAQAVQRSAFPGRYDQQAGQASQLLARFGGNGGSLASGAQGGFTTQTKTTPGVDRSSQRQALLLNYLESGQRYQPDGLLQLKQGLDQSQDTPSNTTTTRRVRVQGPPQAANPSSSAHGAVGEFDGKKVSAWMVPLLKYAREKGWKGTVTSGFRTAAQQDAAARGFGLQHYGPGGPQASNHRKVGFLQGAIDVTDPQTLNKILVAKHSRLQNAGPTDPVHFSVHRNGSY